MRKRPKAITDKSHPLNSKGWDFFMEKKVHTTTITVFNRNSVYREVGELLHQHADNILLRVGYPVKGQNMAIIFLILNMSTDELGALTG